MRVEATVDIFEGVEADIGCYYAPEEKPRGGFPLSNPEPGCDEEFFVEEVFIKGEDVTHFFSEEGMAEILEKVIASLPEPDYEEKSKRWTSRY